MRTASGIRIYKLNAYAKLNLYLDITGKRDDGYHLLETVMQSISLADEVTVVVSGICAEHNANVMDVTQTIMQDLFAMTMMIEISKLNIDYIDFADKLTKAGSDMGLQVHVMHEDIFNAMHRI